jgi:hypothetical protein
MAVLNSSNYSDMFVSLKREDAKPIDNFRISIPPEYQSKVKANNAIDLFSDTSVPKQPFQIKNGIAVEEKKIKHVVEFVNAENSGEKFYNLVEAAKKDPTIQIPRLKGIQVVGYKELPRNKVQFILKLPPDLYDPNTQSFLRPITIEHFSSRFSIKTSNITVSSLSEPDGTRFASVIVKNKRKRAFLDNLLVRLNLGFNSAKNSGFNLSFEISNNTTTNIPPPTDLYRIYYTQPTATIASTPVPAVSPSLSSVASKPTIPVPPPPLPRLSLTPTQEKLLLDKANKRSSVFPSLADVSNIINNKLRFKG